MSAALRSRQQVTAGLHWVRGELDQNLLLARQLIENYADSPESSAPLDMAPLDKSPLDRAMAQLREVRGATALIQVYGAALLAEELLQTLQDVAGGRVPETQPALAAAVSACVQMTDYLDALLSGQDDCALLLQPAVNELRLARGKSLLTEEDLFVAQFTALALRIDPPRAATGAPGPRAEAARLLPVFSSALLSWFKDQDVSRSLSRIGRIAEHLADLSSHPALHQLWRIAAAAVEALLSNALDSSLELKRQFGRLGQLLRLLGEHDEATAARHMSDVSQRLLFHVGRSAGTGPRVSALRRALELEVWLPTPEAVQLRRGRLRGPNAALLSHVAEEIRADLAQIKDNIDMALRPEGDAREFSATGARLKRVADTLLMLGLTDESRALAQPLEILVESGQSQPRTAQAWAEFASAVLQVESRLDSALYRQLRALPGSEAAIAPAESIDLREGTDAVLRESLVNLARVKSRVEAFVKNGDVLGLPDAARLLDEIGAGLRILAQGRADELVLAIRQYLQSADFDRLRSTDGSAERFADAIAGLEYFIEMRRDGQPGSDAALDHLVGFVSRLGEIAPAAGRADATAAAPAVAVEPAAIPLSLMDEAPDALAPIHDAAVTSAAAALPDAGQALLDTDQPPSATPIFGEPPVIVPDPAVTAATPELEQLDSEIREVFLAEAGEVLGLLQRSLPRWLRAPDERELLVEMRRAFHTLKGSGRMVGANEVGEFSWAIETLLNRCLDRTVETSPQAVDTVRQAVALLPALIESFRAARPADPAVAQLSETARQIAARQGASDGADLIAVFRSDATERLGMIGRWIADQDPTAHEYDAPEPVVRAFHTLRGAALAVGARAVGEISGSLENYLAALQQSRLPLRRAGLAVIRDALAAMQDWVTRLGRQPPGPPADAQPWLARIAALRAGAASDPDAQTEDDQQLAEVFAFEALDLVQRFEAQLEQWARTPAAMQHAGALKTTMHTLKGAAGMARCAPITAVAQALNLRLGAWAEGPAPKAGFFVALGALVEGLYGLLDAYRNASLSGDGSDWVARVMQVNPQDPGVQTPVTPPPLVGSTTAPDLELLEVFLLEGEELLEEIETQAAAVSADPGDAAALGSWNRALHTLKGGARLAGLSALGELTHRLETVTERVAADGPRAHDAFRAQLRVAVDGLHALLNDARAGRSPSADAVLRRMDAAAASDASAADALQQPGVEPLPAPPAPVTETEAAPTAAAVTPAATPDTRLETGPEPEPEPASVPAMAPAAATAATAVMAQKEIAFDAELAAIFAPESAELLETLQESLTAWRLDPGATESAREIQRALHTLKGGARIAGLSRMGSLAHALESQVVRIQQGRALADSSGLQDIGQQVEALLRMQDLIEHGQAIQLSGALSDSPIAELAETAGTGAATVGTKTAGTPMPMAAPARSTAWDPLLFWRPEAEDDDASAMRRESARVPVDRLDAMLNQAGEISIYRSRLEENHAALANSINEMAQTVARVREQLRLLDIETEAQIAARGFQRGAEDPGHRYDTQFDALEMDRYSRMQELSRTLAESLSDLGSLHASLDTSASEAEGLLQQQGRVSNEVQQALMGTLMVPFSRQVQRLSRVVRQTAEHNGKRARVDIGGADSELDRNVLERMTAPLEHLLRNAVVHGIEAPELRVAAGKPAEGVVQVNLKREGSQLLIEVGDDGAGLNFTAIRAQAIRRGLMRAEAEVTEDDLARFIFAPGFTTASALTQDAGRGIGMDVVSSDVKQLGGTLDLSSEAGLGTRFRIRLPLMLAVAQALTVQAGDELFAIPLAAVEGIARAPRESLAAMLKDGKTPLQYGGHDYRAMRLSDLVGLPTGTRPESRTVPAILMRLGEGLGGGERRVAVLVDRLIGNREIVSKAAGALLGSVAGVSGATILADGRVMLILDVPALILEATRRQLSAEAASNQATAAAETRPLVMVVDDSITIRRVGERLLTRNGYRVVTAKDGLDAMALLQTESPAAILLDIEMPRADGFEVAAFVRNTERIAKTPIIMITSRSGDKHRDHARSLGVDRYLIKPYQEDQLLAELKNLIGRPRRAAEASA